MNGLIGKRLIVVSILVVILITILGFYVFRVKNPTDKVEVVLGTGHLIDGYHVKYGKDLEARWTAQNFRLSSDGSFMLDLRYDYISENPNQSKVYYSPDNISILEVDLDYVGSVVLLQVGVVYELEPWGDFAHGDLTGLIPLVPKLTDSKSCLVEYEGIFSTEVNVTRVMTLAYGLEVKLSWIRVFTEKNNGTLYYQWLQGDSDVWGGKKLETDKVHSNVSGGFGVYYPIPENVTSPLLPYEFDYVEWIKENVL